ncbi:MAG: hypothetical protein IMY73_03520 [Bacteroidetes bacterium]|nr:hypothetical protein [Bacteroidota bacterium]
MNKTQIIHNDVTIIKHYEIYNSYKQLCKQTKEKYPEVADFVARQYYYEILSSQYNLTPNYICSIVCKTLNNEGQVENEVLRANLNTQSDRIQNNNNEQY